MQTISRSKVSPSSLQKSKTNKIRLSLLFLAAVLLIAVFFAGWHSREQQQNAVLSPNVSLKTLETVAKQSQNERTWSALGRRYQQLGMIDAAHRAFQKAATLDDSDEAAWIGWATTTNGSNAAQDSYGILTSYLQKHPRSGAAHLTLGLLYRQIGSNQQALQQAQLATQLTPRQLDAWRLLGDEASTLGQWAIAEQALRQAISLSPQDWRLQAALGNVLLTQNKLDEARSCFLNAANMTTGDPLAQQTVGTALLKTAISPEQRTLAKRLLVQAKQKPAAALLPPSQSTTLLLRDADELYSERRFSDAEYAYHSVLAQDARSARAYEGIGLILNATGKSETAFFYLLHAITINPNLPAAQAVIGGWCSDTGLNNDARSHLEIAVQIEPNNAAYVHQLGLIYSALEDSSSAEKALRHAVECDQTNALYHADLADVLLINNKLPEAEANYRQAVTLAPQDPDVLSRLGGFLLTTQADPAPQAEAEKLLNAAVAGDPANDYAWYQLGKLALQRNQAPQAVIDLKHAVLASSDVPESWYTLSRAYRLAGDVNSANAAMQRSRQLQALYQSRTHLAETINLHPNDLALHLQIARVYHQLGENAKSIDQYETCIHLSQNSAGTLNATARHELKEIKTSLKASGHLPSMVIFEALLASSAQSKR